MKTEQKYKVKVVTTTLSTPLDKIGAAGAAKAVKAQLRSRGVKNTTVTVVKA